MGRGRGQSSDWPAQLSISRLFTVPFPACEFHNFSIFRSTMILFVKVRSLYKFYFVGRLGLMRAVYILYSSVQKFIGSLGHHSVQRILFTSFNSVMIDNGLAMQWLMKVCGYYYAVYIANGLKTPLNSPFFTLSAGIRKGPWSKCLESLYFVYWWDNF